MPKVPNTIMPTMTTAASRAMTLQCLVITSGLTIMPTEMKKTAPNRSFTGEIRRSMRSASMVPARIEPMTKAPNAAEKPDFIENSTMAKHSPMAMMSICSSLMYRLKRLNNVGIRKMPTVNHMIRKNDSLRMLLTISPPLTLLFSAIDDSITIITTANRSSTMSTANVIGTKRRCRMFRSVKALRMMVVEDIEIMPPRNMLFTSPNPRYLPTTKPRLIMPSTMMRAVRMADPPTSTSFLKLNSSPSENSSTMMPIWAQNSILASTATDGSSSK